LGKKKWKRQVNPAFTYHFLYEGMFGDPTKIGNLSDDIQYLYRGWIIKPQR
jgi:hypothetical protein